MQTGQLVLGVTHTGREFPLCQSCISYPEQPISTGPIIRPPPGSARWLPPPTRACWPHTTLALTPEHVPLGLLQQQVWARDPAVRRNQDHKQRPIDEKERQKWLTSLDAVRAARAASPTTHFISVGDREADVYDLFLAPRSAGVELLVRVTWNRKVDHPEKYLWATLATAPVATT